MIKYISYKDKRFDTMLLDDFDYVLPPERIRRFPRQDRSAGRLLYLAAQQTAVKLFVRDFPSLLKPHDVLVLNNSKVMPARFSALKSCGQVVDCLVTQILSEREAFVMFKGLSDIKYPTVWTLCEGTSLAVLERVERVVRVEWPQGTSVRQWLEQYGQMPIPPYLQRPATVEDKNAYQTVFAQTPGSVAAPTAGLHFDADLLESIRQVGVDIVSVTLHVGLGTFMPIQTTHVEDHVMHEEYFELPASTVEAIELARARGGRVIAVGTTVLRCLETVWRQYQELRPHRGNTQLYVYPGFQFQVVDCLWTNFHWPRSTLLLLVSAFAGVEPIRQAYQMAIEAQYDFYSYGDAMFLEKKECSF